MTHALAQAPAVRASRPGGGESTSRKLAWYLRQLSRLLRVLNDDELDRLLPLLSERRFEPRSSLFSAGDPAEHVYLVLRGRVKIYLVAENGKEIILDVVEQGGIVGDMAIVEDGMRLTYAQALDETVAVTVSWDDFSHLLHSSPRLGFAMAELMARRVVGMQRSLLNLASKQVAARLAIELLERRHGNSIRMGLTHQEMAQVIATSRETVTALLSRFLMLGVLEPEPGGFRVLDSTMLEDIASGAITVSSRHPG